MNTFEKAHNQAVSRQEELKMLGEKLALGSDYLTDEIRRYVQFGDMSHYDNFWNEVNVHRSRDKAIERLKELDVLPSELAYIEKAKEYSDHLLKTEAIAMDAVERSDFDAARRLVFGEYYGEQKALIMGNIKKFQDIINDRTQNQAKNFHEEISFFMMLTNILLFFCGALILFIVCGIGIRHFLNPLKYLTRAMQELAKGNLEVPIQLSVKNNEMLEMAQALKIFKENAIKKNIAELELSKANKSRSLIMDSSFNEIYIFDGVTLKFRQVSRGLVETCNTA
ncbi:MAG: HAMP domain-containing protein [Nitrospinae bacterium]|nr:HAMP domain-containing protein [Nitrospinota bacterium]MBL7019448.1 HAMP domain-containing protein [Nitrospinaceae bacterium]